MNNLMAEIKDDSISRREVINELNDCAELLRCVLDNVDIVGTEREKYRGELRIIEAIISDIKEWPSAEPKVDCQKCIFCGFPGFKQFQQGDVFGIDLSKTPL